MVSNREHIYEWMSKMEAFTELAASYKQLAAEWPAIRDRTSAENDRDSLKEEVDQIYAASDNAARQLCQKLAQQGGKRSRKTRKQTKRRL